MKVRFFLFFLVLSLAGTALAADKVRFAVHFKLNPQYPLPVLAALEKGYWKAQGLEVEYFPFDAPPTLYRAVTAGEIDMGTSGLTGLVEAASAGVPAVVVADPNIVTEFNFWVRTDSPLKVPKDVKGAKIGVTRLGSDSHAYARAVVKALGIEDKDVKFVGMGGGGPHMAGLKAGAIDIATLAKTTMAPLILRGEVRELLRMDDYLPKGVSILALLFARKEFLEKNPGLVKKVVKGFLHGAEFVMKNPDWSTERMKAEFKYSPEVAREIVPWLKYDTRARIDEAKIKNTVEFLLEYGIVAREKVPSLDRLYRKGFTE